MKEQLISFETAKLAKEKGFNLKCYHRVSFIWQDKPTHYLGNYLDTNSENVDGMYSAPTQSLLQKWLREVHNINIFMTFKPNIKKWDFIPYSMDMNAKEYIKYNSEYTKQNNERRFDTYEEALEIGLQEGLKLIKEI
jgi:hypothetical protein